MTQYLVALLFLLAPSGPSPNQPSETPAAFPWGSYAKTDIDALLATKHQSDGMVILMNKVRTHASVAAPASPCKTRAVSKVFEIVGAEPIPATSSCIVLRSPQGRDFKAYVQDSLLPGLQADAPQGTTADWCLLHLWYNAVSGEHAFLVSAFAVSPPTKGGF
jgi:hypothetical protein